MRRISKLCLVLAAPVTVLSFQACVAEYRIPELGDPDAGGFDGSTANDGAVSADGSRPDEAGKDSTTPNDAAVTPDAAADASGDANDANVTPDAGVTSDAAADASGDASDAGVPGALFFDGVDDVVYVSAADGGANETAFTAEVWFKTTTATGTLFEVDGSGADRFLFLLAGKVCFYTYGPGQSVCSTLATYNDGTWHHAAGTLGAVAGQSVYVDGALVGQDLARTASTFTQDNAFAIGRGHTGFLSAVNYYHGRIDEVRVWRVERTGAQIAASRNQNISGATTGLQGYWKFDETGSTATATDATGTHTGGLSGFSFTPSPWQGPGAF